MNGHGFVERMNKALEAINSVIWHDYVLYTVLGVGLLFTLWSGFCQYRALTHGVSVTRGKYDDKNDPGAINHFQALSAALSATVGLGNIAGVALAISLGGPGAVFWMWMVGLVGMALKTTEVALSMIYRNTNDPDNPHGGPMYVAAAGFKKMGLPTVGKVVAAIFVVTLLISTITGGNMFQAWNVADVTHTYFHVPVQVTGVALAVLVGMVIIGGIKRIGAVAGKLVPFMCTIYLIAALWVILKDIDRVPEMLRLIVNSAFSPANAENAFIGGTAGYALFWGMKRALFSSEAGQGSSPIAHSAAKTDEPVREAVVAGLEPFIDTIVVCTLTTLVILLSGQWNRTPDIDFGDTPPAMVQVEEGWTIAPTPIVKTPGGEWSDNVPVYTVIEAEDNKQTSNKLHRMIGEITGDENTGYTVLWNVHQGADKPTLVRNGLYFKYEGASLTAKAFDRVTPGLGMWLVPFASWLFAVSTMISWSYYGEQGVVYLLGSRAVMGYKLIYILLILVACGGFIKSDAELDGLTALGTGVMLWANIPIMLVFSVTAMTTYHSYFRRLKAGEFHPHKAPSITDVVEGKDVE